MFCRPLLFSHDTVVRATDVDVRRWALLLFPAAERSTVPHAAFHSLLSGHVNWLQAPLLRSEQLLAHVSELRWHLCARFSNTFV